MILTLHTETVIDSSHQLVGYKGKCAFLHGHSWLLECWFRGDDSECDKVGILVDFSIVTKIKEQLDHTYINKVVKHNPTAEFLSKWIYKQLKKLINNKEIQVKVKLYETAVGKMTWCELGDF